MGYMKYLPTTQLKRSSESVTRKLQQETQAPIVAKVVTEGWRRLGRYERFLLIGLNQHWAERVWTREVVLHDKDRARVLARVSIEPQTIFQLPWLARLGSKPLGSILFHEYQPLRILLSDQQISPRQLRDRFSQRAAQHLPHIDTEQSLPVRSCLLQFGSKTWQILITECFL